MRTRRVLPLLIATLATCALSFAGEVTGKWVGKVSLEADKKTMESIQANGGAKLLPTVDLEFMANKTYKSKQHGGKDNVEHTSEGTWSQSGTKVVLTPKKRDGKAVTGEAGKPKTYTLSKDGSTLVLDLTPQVKPGAKTPDGKPMPKIIVKVVLHRSK